MRSTKRLNLALVSAVAFLLPTPCFAGAGAAYLSNLVQFGLLPELMAAFWGLAAGAVFYYAVRMVLEAQKEEAGKDLSNAFIFAITGFAIIACASAFASAFGVGVLSTDAVADVNPGILDFSIMSVANFIIKMSAGVFVLIIVITGLKMIATQGESSNFDKWRKVLVANCIGVVMMLTAYFVIHAVSDINSAMLITEMRGLALWMLTIIGFVCVVALIIAGILLIVSIDESLKDRAKRIVIGTLISLLIVIACYTLIIVFMPTSATVPSLS